MKIMPSVFNTSSRLGLAGLCFFLTSCDGPKEESRSKELLPIESGGTQLTTNQNLMLDQILGIAGGERQGFLDFVGGEAELAKLLNSDFLGEWHVEQVKNTLIASDFQKWAVVTIQSAKDLPTSTNFWQGVPIRSNDLPKDIFKIGPPVTGQVVRDGSNKPHVRIAWKSIESFWGLAAGDLDFQLKDEQLDIKKWAPGLFLWHDK
jgi:hypothetical protein